MKDKKQTVQMAGTAVLIAVAAGYMVFSLTGEGTSPILASSSGQPMVGYGSSFHTITTVAAVSTSSVVVDESQPETDGVMPVAGGRDPFTPRLFGSSPGQNYKPKPMNTQIPARMDSRRSVPPIMPNMGGLITPLPPSASTGNGVKPQPVQEPIPQFTLTGVITGRSNVGILRLGESRYIVKEGQKIDGIYEVVSVSQEGVLIARDGRSVFLKLGGQDNASQK